MSRYFWNPSFDFLGEARRMQREMNRLMASNAGLGRSTGLFPALNVCSDDKALTVRCEMPGVPMEALDIALTRDTLTIKGQRELGLEGQDVSFHRRERRGGQFNRTLTLPFEVDPERASATYKDGVLVLRMERAAASMPRQLSVRAE